MPQGIILYLNGVTSTGKTTLANSLQEQANVNFYNFSNDIFQQMISRKFLEQNYWKYLSEAIIQAYKTAKLMSDNGINVIYDGMILDVDELKPHYEKIKTIFSNSPLKMIEVYCPLKICKQRNIERGDRGINQSEEQNSIMVKNIKYDISVDTSINDSKECAKIILNGIVAL